MKLNVLMVCYYYPPLMDVGSKRSVVFSELFRKNGWDPYVISVSNPDELYCTVGNDAPPDGIPTEYSFSLLNVYKILGKANGFLSWLLKLVNITLRRNYLLDVFCIPDLFAGWIPHAVIKGLQSIRENKADLIYVSCSPFSSAIIGMLLKKLTGKPLVIDFRDPFALKELSMMQGTPQWRVKIDERIENSIIKAADLFIVNTEEVKNAYLLQYPAARGKTHAVPNGFDDRQMIRGELPKHEKFTIIYAGQFYFYDKRNDIHTDAFFRALALLKASGDIEAQNFQFLYFGDGKDQISDIARDHEVNDLVICSDKIPQAEILQKIKKSHLQLLRISKPMVCTKLFEGIALNIPFLATIPRGETAEIVNRYSPGSSVISGMDPGMMARAILSARDKYSKGCMPDNLIDEFMELYSRNNLTLKLMKIIDENISLRVRRQAERCAQC